MTEEERATLFREQYAARARDRRDRYVGLAGNREARVALDEAWRPFLLASLEVQGFGDDSEFLEEMYVEVPQKDVYITEIPDDQLI